MKQHAEELARRRQALTLRSERLRREMVEDAEVIGETATRVEEGVDAARRYASPLLWVAGGALLLFLLANPARSVAWLARGATLFAAARRGMALYRQVRAQLPPPHG